MKNILIFNRNITITILLLFLSGVVQNSALAQNDRERVEKRGSTHRIIDANNFVEVGIAPTYEPLIYPESQKLLKPTHGTGPLQETNDLDFYLPAGKHFTIQFDNQNKSLNFIYPESDFQFSMTVQAAIRKAPRWMKNDLINIFSLLESQYQEKWANTILEANDPYVDEIAFCIAHLSPQYLMSNYATSELLDLNAKLIYENDKYLDYVEVVDYGTSQTDPDYYSTTKYRKAIYIDTTEVEVPREIYYWYIVHPKITDEIPAFIDPDIPEYTHQENITDSENGYFWRNFLFYHADPGYAKFKDMIRDCKIVWNEISSTVSVGAHAIEIMNRWLNAAVLFTSENDRPHQPVRIYRKHIGRCGEFGDMRVAIARSALIPAANVATYSRDHVWNEFWDEKWIHWDGTINKPLMYVDDWGKELNSVTRWRSDGHLSSVTKTYTRDNAILTIYALDSLDNPIDGARVILYAPGLYEDKAFDNYDVTDNEGKVTFIVGAGRTYWARMSCDYGNVPSGSGQVLRVISNSQDDEEYAVSMRIDAKKSMRSCEEIALPGIEDRRYFLEIDIKTPSQILCGRDLFDDMNNGAYQFIKKESGTLNFFMTDESNYQSFIMDQQYQGFNSLSGSESISSGFEFGENSKWYCVFDNFNSMHTLQHLTGSVKLFSVYDPEITQVQILSNYPNPMRPQSSGTTILYQLPQKSKVELTIYDILGKKIITLIDEIRYAGQFSTSWDGRNELNQLVSSGVYLCTIKTDQGVSSRKMAVIR